MSVFIPVLAGLGGSALLVTVTIIVISYAGYHGKPVEKLIDRFFDWCDSVASKLPPKSKGI